MKNVFKTFLAAIFLMSAAGAFAQCVPAPQIMGQPAHCWGDQVVNVGGVQQVISQPGTVYNSGVPSQVMYPSNPLMYNGAQLMPYGNQPGMFAGGGNIYRCSMLTQTIGTLAGGYLGYEIGRRIRVGNTHLNGLGAVGGAIAGDNIACEIVAAISAPPQQTRVVVQQAQPAQYVQAGGQQIYTTQAAQTMPVPQSVRGTMCNVDGTVIEVGSNEDCRKVAMMKAQALVPASAQTTSVNVASSGKSYDQGASRVTPERQAAIDHGCKSQTAEWRKLNWPGHPAHDNFVCMEPDDTHRY